MQAGFEDRTYKLDPDTTSEYGRYVESLPGPVTGEFRGGANWVPTGAAVCAGAGRVLAVGWTEPMGRAASSGATRPNSGQQVLPEAEPVAVAVFDFELTAVMRLVAGFVEQLRALP